MKAKYGVVKRLLAAVLIVLGANTVFAHYDPSAGRWVNRDPSGEQGGINLYSYVFNNPQFWFDSYGEKPGDTYCTMEDAARAALQDINDTSIKEEKEYAGRTYQTKYGYTYGPPKSGGPGSVRTPPVDKKMGKPSGVYHTHGGPAPGNPRYSSAWEHFSQGDKVGDLDGMQRYGKPWSDYLGTPSGGFKQWDSSQPMSEGKETDLGKLKDKTPCQK